MKYIVLMLLLYIQLKSVVVAGDDRPSSCCLEVHKNRVPISNLSDYYIQKSPPCNIRAVRFYTRKGKTLCWDPEETWAKIKMKEIDAKKTTPPPIGPMCRTSTSTRIPSTPIKTSGPETKTSSRAITSISTSLSKGTTFKTTGPETKTSSRAITSISTAPSKGTTFKTTELKPEIKTTSTKQATVSTESSKSPLSSTNPCTEPNPHSTESSHETTRTEPLTTSTTNDRATTRKKPPSKIIQRKRKKSKKQLRKYQMNNRS